MLKTTESCLPWFHERKNIKINMFNFVLRILVGWHEINVIHESVAPIINVSSIIRSPHARNASCCCSPQRCWRWQRRRRDWMQSRHASQRSTQHSNPHSESQQHCRARAVRHRDAPTMSSSGVLRKGLLVSRARSGGRPEFNLAIRFLSSSVSDSHVAGLDVPGDRNVDIFDRVLKSKQVNPFVVLRWVRYGFWLNSTQSPGFA